MLKPKSGGGFAAGGPRGKAAVTAEHFGLVFGGESRAFIADDTFGVVVRRADGDKNLFVRRRKFQRVGNQIVQNLVEREDIRQHDDGFRRENRSGS